MKEKKFTDLKLSELIEKSLKLGKIPVVTFEDKPGYVTQEEYDKLKQCADARKQEILRLQELLNSTPNPEPSAATESDQGGEDGKQNKQSL